MEITFLNPKYLWILGFLPFIVLFHFYTLKYSEKRALKFANFEALKRVTGGYAISKNWGLFFLRLVIFGLVVFALAEPVLWYVADTTDYDFVIAIDSSGSMLATDFSPNRLSVAKDAASEFIGQLPKKSSVAVISFSGMSFIDEVLTSDHQKANQSIMSIEVKSIPGTGIAESLKTAANLLIPSKKSKKIIIITDGQENIATERELSKVLEYLSINKIRVYSIGIGTPEGGKLPGIEATSELDEKTLRNIAEMTGGEYYHAYDIKSLKKSFENIAESKKSEVPLNLQIPFILVALSLLFLEWTLINTRYRSIP